MFRKDRNCLGGGIFILIHKSLTAVEQPELSTDCEILWAKLKLQNRKDLNVGCFYMPHRNKHDMEQLDKSLNLLTQNGKKDCPIVLAGDFNCPHINWINHTTHSTGKDNDIQQSLVDIMQSSTLTQVHHSPTRFMNILDLIFFSNPSLVKSSVSVLGISDHEMIVTDADTRPQRTTPLAKKCFQTRQRRELLNQKMGKTPEAAPRKRRTPLAEDWVSGNAAQESEQEEEADDSPKRQRMRDNEQAIKADTPAIPSVRSRLHNLASRHAQFSESTGEEEASGPVPVPRKSLSSPPLDRARPHPHQGENTQPSSSRRKRFAQLADHINNWEDDLSHPSIVKEEEKKPRWQPPKAATAPATSHISSPKKTLAPPPPTSQATSGFSQTPKEIPSSPRWQPPKAATAPATSHISSPKKTLAPPPPTSQVTSGFSQTPKEIPSSPSLSSKPPVSTPARSGSKVGFNSTPRPFQPYSERVARATSIRSPASSPSKLPQQGEVQKQTPKVAPKPAGKPLSANLASWERKTSEATGGSSATARSGTVGSTPVSQTFKQSCSPARHPSAPARDEEPTVQMRPKVRKSVDDEPTAHSVSARMSAWEQMSSAQVVSDIKKVQPGSTTPVKTPSGSTLGAGRSPSRASVRATTPSKTPSFFMPSKSSSLTPSKSFKDSIKERAAQVNPITAAEAQQGSGSPPGQTKGLSPKKASSAMKAVQQQLVQQTQSTSMAERIRQERMAELQSIQQRWKNGILNEETPAGDETPEADTVSKIQDVREQARADFNKKLASVGMGAGASGGKSATMPHKSQSATSASIPRAPLPPPLPSSSSSKVTPGRPPQPTSLYKIVSQKKQQQGDVSSSRSLPAHTPSKTGRRVKFDDSFDSDDDEEEEESKASTPQKQVFEENANLVTGVEDDESESDTSEESPTEDDTDFDVVLRRPPRPGNPQQRPRPRDDDDDLSLSAFVPASVRRQSILPSPQQQQRGNEHRRDTSTESSDREPRVPSYGHQGTRRQQTYPEMESSSSLTSQSSVNSDSDHPETKPQSGYRPDDTEDSLDDRDAIGDLLAEAMDSSESEDLATSDRRHTPVVMRKRPSHRKATEDGNLPFSINDYRASRNMQVLEVKQSIVLNSQHSGKKVREVEVEMPTHPPTPAPRQSVHERVRELQELIQQEQSVIMQTSNALNQCCSTSYFAGSSEQVECNRILLIACQKRQAYMMEVQRLRDSKVLDPSGPGPKGSLTISDIRLPLKKEFVTKIGTSHDTTTYYFILLLRNGPQVISTQMLSTHDPMMRGSLDFPNLIKINGITGTFKLQLEIYSMSVSIEAVGKGKKKKTPKKAGKGGAHTGTAYLGMVEEFQSPAGPVALYSGNC
ncbi:hypothetical protein ACOMHN_002655 [Nucella lapillus]